MIKYKIVKRHDYWELLQVDVVKKVIVIHSTMSGLDMLAYLNWIAADWEFYKVTS